MLARSAEPVIEQVVGLELGEGSGAFPPSVPQDPGHRQPGVVVHNALGHPVQEGERRDGAVQKRLGGLRGVGLHEAAVAVEQVQDEAVGLLLHPADDHPGLSEVALGMALQMGQQHKQLPCLAPPLPDVVLDDGVLARESMFLPQTLVDALGRVALLPGDAQVRRLYPVDDAGERLQLGAAGRVLPPR